MAKVKYVVKEYNPSENQQGVHSFYAQARQDNTITNAEIAEKIGEEFRAFREKLENKQKEG